MDVDRGDGKSSRRHIGKHSLATMKFAMPKLRDTTSSWRDHSPAIHVDPRRLPIVFKPFQALVCPHHARHGGQGSDRSSVAFSETCCGEEYEEAVYRPGPIPFAGRETAHNTRGESTTTSFMVVEYRSLEASSRC